MYKPPKWKLLHLWLTVYKATLCQSSESQGENVLMDNFVILMSYNCRGKGGPLTLDLPQSGQHSHKHGRKATSMANHSHTYT